MINGNKTRREAEKGRYSEVDEKRYEIPVVVISYAPSCEIAVMVTSQHALLTGRAVVSPGRGVILAARTEKPAGLCDHRQRDAPTRRIHGDGEEQVDHYVRKEESHQKHGTVIRDVIGRFISREVSGPYGGCYIEHPV